MKGDATMEKKENSVTEKKEERSIIGNIDLDEEFFESDPFAAIEYYCAIFKSPPEDLTPPNENEKKKRRRTKRTTNKGKGK